MYLSRRCYIILTVIILLFIGGYLFVPLYYIGQAVFYLFLIVAIYDGVCLYRTKNGIQARRICADRFSNGDDNEILLPIQNLYARTIFLEVIDEIPFIFQERDILFKLSLHPKEEKTISYRLKPTRRGVYSFGQIRIFVHSQLGLIVRRYTCVTPADIKVYPSYLMLHRYELLAISNNLKEMGIKKIRRIGHQTEFEQIKDYVKGDDFRTINWNASARRHQLMVNVYEDERSQHIYNVIDKGRVMQQTFHRMTLLDYAINASLMLSYVAIHKEDKAGLITFDTHFDSFVPASKRSGQLQILLEDLYRQTTTFGETDYSNLCIHVKKQLSHRSLLILYTNFANLRSMKRQLPYLQQLSRDHRILVVFFEDSEIKEYLQHAPANTEEYFQHVIAEKFTYEKRLIVSTLKQNGIFSLLTTPKSLTIDVINKYLEMKSRQQI